MSQFAVEFHPLAADEAQAAERWYRERNETASGRFQRELDRAIARISPWPETGSAYLSNTTRVLLRRSPFFVVYRVRGDDLEIVAVAHARRRPGYARTRSRTFRWFEEISRPQHSKVIPPQDNERWLDCNGIDLQWTLQSFATRSTGAYRGGTTDRIKTASLATKRLKLRCAL